MVRDNYSLVEQLGLDPHEVAKSKAQHGHQQRFIDWYQGELKRVPEVTNTCRQPFSGDADSDPENFVLSNLQNIWNARLLGDISIAYAKDARLHASANRDLQGHEQIISLYSGFLGSLSGLRFSADYVCSVPNKESGTDVAVRWTLCGSHTGTALWDEPTGIPLLVIGESHYHVNDGKIQEEWTVFDELSILVEIYRARLADEQQDE